jgi:hypothetical protein
MKLYKIEKGIKLPMTNLVNVGTSTTRATATLAQLKPGEGFLITDAMEGVLSPKRMRDYARRENARGNSKIFAVRRLENGVRIWRTSEFGSTISARR